MFIEIDDLTKSYGNNDSKVQILKGINCNISKGDIALFLGPSGSGKSTLLNIVGGIETCDSGMINIDNINLLKLSNKELSEYRRKKLGFVFQFYHLVPNLTVKENIEVGHYLSSNPFNIDDIIKELKLENHIDKLPNQLSGGQQQRTSIGRAIIKNPDILICDEPTGALDYETAIEVLKLIQEINQKYGCTILMATHNTAISKMAHKVFKLHNGKIVLSEEKNTVIDANEIVW